MPEENILILGIEKGSIRVIFQVVDPNNNVILEVDGTEMTAAVETVLAGAQVGQNNVRIRQHPVFR